MRIIAEAMGPYTASKTIGSFKQGHLVTLDMLLGVKVLDTRLGVLVLA